MPERIKKGRIEDQYAQLPGSGTVAEMLQAIQKDLTFLSVTDPNIKKIDGGDVKVGWKANGKVYMGLLIYVCPETKWLCIEDADGSPALIGYLSDQNKARWSIDKRVEEV